VVCRLTIIIVNLLTCILGAHNAIQNSLDIGGNAFGLFLKNQKQWAFKPLADEVKVQFLDGCKHHKYASSDESHAPIVPHGSYLVNLAHPEKIREEQAYTSFIDDLSRCHNLGIALYNFHPGNAAGAPNRLEALQQLARQINKAHKDEASGKVITLLETMAAVGGNTIGSTFEEIAEIIAMVNDKDRVGVCLDTCHVFAAGYDLRKPEAYNDTMEKFDKVIGLKYLKALHINDSKAPLASGRDLHANLGTGFLGLGSFWNIVNDPRLWGLPFILETPGGWVAEIKLLESLVGMDRSSEDFKEMESKLFALGKENRDEIQGQVDRRNNKSPKKRKKKAKTEDTEDELD
jgi:AP endonuclease-1